MLCIKLDNAYKTLGTLSLYGEISLNVGGSELVAKSYLTLAAPWTVARQAPLSMGLPRQEYWSGLPFPSPGDPPDPRLNLGLLHWQVNSLPTEPPGKPIKC